MVDVQCISPLAPSRVASYVNVATSLDRAEKLKARKYSAAALELNAEFSPFIVTLQGDIGPAALSLLERLESQVQAAFDDCYPKSLSESSNLGKTQMPCEQMASEQANFCCSWGQMSMNADIRNWSI
jgi:hypothetical protein